MPSRKVKLNEFRVFLAGDTYIFFPPRRLWRTAIQSNRFWNCLNVTVDNDMNVTNQLVKTRRLVNEKGTALKIGVRLDIDEVPTQVLNILKIRDDWY